MKLKFLLILFVLSALFSYLIGQYNTSTAIRFTRVFDLEKKTIRSKLALDNTYQNLIFDYEAPYCLTYTEPFGQNNLVLYKKIDLRTGSIKTQDSLENSKKLMNFTDSIIHYLSTTNELTTVNVYTKEKKIVPLPDKCELFKSVYLNPTSLLFLGEIYSQPDFITGFFKLNLATNELIPLEVLEKNKTPKASENSLKYLGYFSPQGKNHIGYTYNVFPRLSVISSSDTVVSIDLLAKENATFPVIDMYQNQYFYSKKVCYSQGFFIQHNSYYVVSLLDIDPHEDLILDRYTTEGYTTSIQVTSSPYCNTQDLYIGLYDNIPYLITYNAIYKLNH